MPRSSSRRSLAPLELNNTGVRLLMQGRHADAGEAFSKAVSSAKLCIQKLRDVVQNELSASNPTPVESPCTQTTDGSAVERSSQSQQLVDTQAPSLSSDGSSSSDFESPKTSLDDPSNNFFFSQPIFLESDEFSACDHQFLTKLTVVALFNLALTHHRCALSAPEGSDEDERTAHFQKALKLYEISCKLQVRGKVLLEDTYVLAHMNNLGHVHAALGNQIQSRRCFESLLRKLVFYRESTRGQSQKREGMDVFHHNTSQLVLQDPLLAPAA